MALFHINDRGEPGKCRAEKNCPFGGFEDHYYSKDAARDGYELKQERLLAAENQAPIYAVKPEVFKKFMVLEQKFEDGTSQFYSVYRNGRAGDTQVEWEELYPQAEEDWQTIHTFSLTDHSKDIRIVADDWKNLSTSTRTQLARLASSLPGQPVKVNSKTWDFDAGQLAEANVIAEQKRQRRERVQTTLGKALAPGWEKMLPYGYSVKEKNGYSSRPERVQAYLASVSWPSIKEHFALLVAHDYDMMSEELVQKYSNAMSFREQHILAEGRELASETAELSESQKKGPLTEGLAPEGPLYQDAIVQHEKLTEKIAENKKKLQALDHELLTLRKDKEALTLQ